MNTKDLYKESNLGQLLLKIVRNDYKTINEQELLNGLIFRQEIDKLTMEKNAEKYWKGYGAKEQKVQEQRMINEIITSGQKEWETIKIGEGWDAYSIPIFGENKKCEDQILQRRIEHTKKNLPKICAYLMLIEQTGYKWKIEFSKREYYPSIDYLMIDVRK